MGKLKFNRKGDLSAKWIVTIVLLIVGFGILLFFILRFMWQEQVNKEVCHQSVVLRATMPSMAENYIPLKCKTAKYCFTAGNSKCDGKGEDFYNEDGITKVKVKNKEDIERFMAQEIVDCWSMMGEGKVSLFTQYWAKTVGFGEVYPSCVICSRMAFDKKSLGEAKIDLAKVNVLEYMLTHQPQGKDVSYIKYFSGEKGKISLTPEISEINKVVPMLGEDLKKEKLKEMPKEVGEAVEKEGKWTEEKVKVEEGKELSVLFMQISSPEPLESIKNIGVALGIGTAGIFAISKPIGAMATVSIVKGIFAHPVIAAIAVISGLSIQQGMVAWNRAITAGKCGDVSLGSQARDGCSVVRTVSYDLEDISQYCQVIESIP